MCTSVFFCFFGLISDQVNVIVSTSPGGVQRVAIALVHHLISRVTLVSRWDLMNTDGGTVFGLSRAKNVFCKQDGKLAFFILTSANLSKAAWGSISKDGSSCMVNSLAETFHVTAHSSR